jgi:hypothetical protein
MYPGGTAANRGGNAGGSAVIKIYPGGIVADRVARGHFGRSAVLNVNPGGIILEGVIRQGGGDIITPESIAVILQSAVIQIYHAGRIGINAVGGILYGAVVQVTA